jgi:signal transduction histidine kinase
MTTEGLLLRGHLDEVDREGVRRIKICRERMTRMIVELLDFTRVRLGGGFPLEPKPTDLRAVCRSVVDELDGSIHLEVEGDVTGTWDPDRLAEALSNLAGNAVEHARPGTAVVVRAHTEGAEAVVEVINQGDPIPADMLPFLFEPFRRGKRERPASGNLGLGLYIAKHIVLASGGALDARSVDGTTTFVMRLPREPSPASPAPSKAAAGANH